jgi:hypothetical protein
MTDKFLEDEKFFNLVLSPDSFKDLPNLLQEAEAYKRRH